MALLLSFNVAVVTFLSFKAAEVWNALVLLTFLEMLVDVFLFRSCLTSSQCVLNYHATAIKLLRLCRHQVGASIWCKSWIWQWVKLTLSAGWVHQDWVQHLLRWRHLEHGLGRALRLHLTWDGVYVLGIDHRVAISIDTISVPKAVPLGLCWNVSLLIVYQHRWVWAKDEILLIKTVTRRILGQHWIPGWLLTNPATRTFSSILFETMVLVVIQTLFSFIKVVVFAFLVQFVPPHHFVGESLDLTVLSSMIYIRGHGYLGLINLTPATEARCLVA